MILRIKTTAEKVALAAVTLALVALLGPSVAGTAGPETAFASIADDASIEATTIPAPVPSDSSSIGVFGPSSEPTTPVSLITTAVPPPAPWVRSANVRGGMTKATAIRRITVERPFRVFVRYTYGPKGRVVSVAPSKYWRHIYRWNTHDGKRVRTWRRNTLFVMTVGTGAPRGPWRKATVSWYGPGFYGHGMAGGGVLRPDSMVVAHRTLPFGTKVAIRYRGRWAIAVVKDRGPFVRGRQFDLGPGVAKKLRFQGVGKISYCILGR